MTCYLEVKTIRRLLDHERAPAVVGRKGHYLWIYRTVISDEEKIGLVARRNGLEVE